jgi:primosomal protein N'
MGRFRQRIIIKYKDNARTREFLSALLTEGLKTAPKGVRVELDVNPALI